MRFWAKTAGHRTALLLGIGVAFLAVAAVCAVMARTLSTVALATGDSPAPLPAVTPTATPTATPTEKPSTPTATASPTQKPPTPTATPTPQPPTPTPPPPTPTAAVSRTATPTRSPTPQGTPPPPPPSGTPVPPTATATPRPPTPTSAPFTPTFTPGAATPTAVPPTATAGGTATSVPATATPRSFVLHYEWPRKMDVSDDEAVQLTISGPAAPTPLATAGHTTATVIVPTPTPVPGGGRLVLVAATVNLLVTSFDVEPRQPERQHVSPSGSTTWGWTIHPKEKGSRTVTFSVTLEYQAEGDGDPVNIGLPPRSETVEVGESLFTRSQLNVTALFTGMMGSGMSCPFLYTLWKDRRAARASKEPKKRPKNRT